MSETTPTPLYYPDANPDSKRDCRRCKKSVSKLTKAKATRHLLACLQRELNELGAQQVLNRLKMNADSACQWTSCARSFGTAKFDISHNMLAGSMRTFADGSLVNLLQTPVTVLFCYECGLWTESNLVLEVRCETNVSFADTSLVKGCLSLLQNVYFVLVTRAPGPASASISIRTALIFTATSANISRDPSCGRSNVLTRAASLE
ncbi:hypothetical protein D6D17_09618, partial [Aureobasidium pullulans]